LQNRLGVAAPAQLYAMGNVAILQQRLSGLICSIKCPGSIILKTFDTVRALRDSGVTMVGGFLSRWNAIALIFVTRQTSNSSLSGKTTHGLRLGSVAVK